jgi:hypothetical protein
MTLQALVTKNSALERGGDGDPARIRFVELVEHGLQGRNRDEQRDTGDEGDPGDCQAAQHVRSVPSRALDDIGPSP